MTVTVLTPTYNRADKLGILYDSLVSQTNKYFKWLIIDDGSEDNTSEIVSEFIENADFEIEYIKKENGANSDKAEVWKTACLKEKENTNKLMHLLTLPFGYAIYLK